MSRIVAFPELTGEQLVDLQRLLRSRSTPAGVQRRASLIWELAAGSSLAEASEAVGLHYTNAHRWVRRFLASGVKGLADGPRSGRPLDYDAQATTEILQVATAQPGDLGLEFTTWSLPKLEEYLRQRPRLKHLARSTIRRRLRAAGLRYRAGQTWCQSADPDFEVKKPSREPVLQPYPEGDRGLHGRDGATPDDSPRRTQLGPARGPTP
jgi:transposase